MIVRLKLEQKGKRSIPAELTGSAARWNRVVVTAALLTLLGGSTHTAVAASSASVCNHIGDGNRTYVGRGYVTNGPVVTQVQCLVDHGSSTYSRWIAEDGIFGDATYRAVLAVQACNHLRIDGIVGSDTWYRLYHPIGGCAL